MPQSPEFFMGGGGAVQHGARLHGVPADAPARRHLQRAQVLKPETVATMRQNQMGDLKVVTLKTVQPKLSKDANFFPQMVHNWGFSFDINTEPGPHGRSAGSLCWAGLFNTYFWLDPKARVTGTIMTQILPFVDDDVMEPLRATRERGLRRPEGGVTYRHRPPETCSPRRPSGSGSPASGEPAAEPG